MARRPITLEELDRLEIDPDSMQFFWNGQEVVTKAMIDFPTWVDIAVGVAAAAGALHIILKVADRFGWLPPPKTRAPDNPWG